MVTSTRMPLFTRGSWSEVSRISALLGRETVCGAILSVCPARTAGVFYAATNGLAACLGNRRPDTPRHGRSLHRHIAVSRGAIGGLIIGSVEGRLNTRKVDKGFDVKHRSKPPLDTATSNERQGASVNTCTPTTIRACTAIYACLACPGVSHNPRMATLVAAFLVTSPGPASYCGHHRHADNWRNA
jgi:hypothetical protein